MTQYSYVVTHDPDSGANILTNDIISIECTDTGTGEVKSAKIKLNARAGKYITSSPVLTQFDKIKIKITDSDSKDYEQIYEVDRLLPIKNSSEGYILEVELLGQEHYLQKIDIAKQFFFSNAQNVTEGLCDFFNDINGTAQPDIQNHNVTTSGNNELPTWTNNNYMFGVSEIKTYDALMEVVEGLGASVANGGAADFFELYFDSNIADTSKINFKAFVSGSKPTAGNEIIITDSIAVNESPTEGGIDALTGTLVKAWGKKGSGTLPQSIESFRGELEAFQLIPDHVTGTTYPAGARVQLAGTVYQADSETSNTPPTDWTSKKFFDIQGSNGYSEWTDALKDEWQSSGSDPSTANKGKGCWDSNLVIEDGVEFQTWVIKRLNTSAVGAGSGQIPSNYLYSATKAYRGLRFLIDPNIATIAGDFALNSGKDRFGKTYSKNIVQHNGGANTGSNAYKNWDVVHVSTDSEYVAVRDEGRVYVRSSGTWTDDSGTARRNHCFHIVNTITNVAGYNNTASDGGGNTYGDTSAVEWRWTYTALDSFPSNFFTSDGFYKIGAWANFSFPFPENSYFSNTIGSLYGNNTTKLEPVTLDANNMHLTRSAKVGFNNTEAKDLGIIDGIQFWNKFKWTDALGNTLQGNFKMRCTMYDTSDNVVIQDFVLPFNDIWHFVKLQFSGFKPYRARTPRVDVVPTIFVKDIEILNVFQWKNIKLISLQWQEVYDDEGRFQPVFSRAITGALAGTADIRLAIDAFCFTKPLLGVTAVVSDRPIEPTTMELPDIDNSVQLNQIVNSQLDIEKFQHKEFTITTSGKININFGDTFFLTDSKLVNDADTRTADSGGTANTIRLVAKRIVYSITKKPGTGAQSFLRTITGIKRIIT